MASHSIYTHKYTNTDLKYFSQVAETTSTWVKWDNAYADSAGN